MFDALLVEPAELASRILAAGTALRNASLSNSTEHDVENRQDPVTPSTSSTWKTWKSWYVEGGPAVTVAAATKAVRGAAESLYNEIEAEIVLAAARGKRRTKPVG